MKIQFDGNVIHPFEKDGRWYLKQDDFKPVVKKLDELVEKKIVTRHPIPNFLLNYRVVDPELEEIQQDTIMIIEDTMGTTKFFNPHAFKVALEKAANA